MERENFVPEELTGQAENSYSRGGGDIMPEGSSGPGPEAAIPIGTTPEFSADQLSQERARIHAEAGGEPLTHEARQVDEALGELAGAPVLPSTEGGAGMPPGGRPPTGEDSAGRGADGNDRRRGPDNSGGRASREDEAHRIFMSKFLGHVAKPAVQNLLRSEHPNFHQVGVPEGNRDRDVEAFVKFIETINASSGEIVTLATLVSGENISIPNEEGEETASIPLTPEARKLLFEWSVERLISIPDKSPEAHYSIGGFRAQDILDQLKSLSITAFDEDKLDEHGNKVFEGFSEKIASTIESRMLFHELRRKLTSKEEYAGFLIEGLRTHGIHFVQNEMAGVHQVISQIERSYFHKVSENYDSRTKTSEWISAKQADEAEKEAEARVNEMWEAGLLKVGDRPLTEWEKDRAVRLALTFFAGLQRKAVAVGVGDLPGETSKRIGSRPTEYIFRTLYAVKSIGIRFHGQGPAQKDMISRILRRKKEQESTAHSQTKSLLGVSEETMMANQWGAPDLQSHGWRSQFLFMSGIKINGRGTFLDVFNEVTNKYHLTVDEQTGKVHPLYGFKGEQNKERFESEIADLVLGQNLYLSVLARQDFSEDLKARIWQKRASLDPLAVATLRPEIIASLTPEERQMWERIIPHLDIAHGARMQRELVRYGNDEHGREHGNGLSEEDLRTEAGKWNGGISDETKYQLLRDSYLLDIYAPSEIDTSNMNPEEKARVLQERITRFEKSDQGKLLKLVIDKGYGEANYLATAVFPHTYMLDDAPYVAWAALDDGSGMGDENMLRGFGDQKTLQEAGWAPMNNLFQHPKLGEVGEVFDKSYAEGLAMIHSPGDARKYLEPFILGWLDFASATEKSLWFGLFEKERGVARSALEKYYPKTFIAMDEESKSNWLDARAQAGSVTPDQKGLNKIKAKAKASRWRLAYKFIRTWIQILPVAFVTQFAKMIGMEIKGALEENAA